MGVWEVRIGADSVRRRGVGGEGESVSRQLARVERRKGRRWRRDRVSEQSGTFRKKPGRAQEG